MYEDSIPYLGSEGTLGTAFITWYSLYQLQSFVDNSGSSTNKVCTSSTPT